MKNFSMVINTHKYFVVFILLMLSNLFSFAQEIKYEEEYANRLYFKRQTIKNIEALDYDISIYTDSISSKDVIRPVCFSRRFKLREDSLLWDRRHLAKEEETELFLFVTEREYVITGVKIKVYVYDNFLKDIELKALLYFNPEFGILEINNYTNRPLTKAIASKTIKDNDSNIKLSLIADAVTSDSTFFPVPTEIKCKEAFLQKKYLSLDNI